MFLYSNSDRPHGFDWSVFIAGVLSFLLGIFILKYPSKGLRGLVLAFALVSILQGLMWIGSFVKFRQFFSRSWVTLISGVIDLAIGILFLFDNNLGALTISLIVALWFLTDSIIAIVFSAHLVTFGKGYFVFNLILNILTLVMSILMLFNPALTAFSLVYLIAFYLILFGFNEVVVAWVHR